MIRIDPTHICRRDQRRWRGSFRLTARDRDCRIAIAKAKAKARADAEQHADNQSLQGRPSAIAPRHSNALMIAAMAATLSEFGGWR